MYTYCQIAKHLRIQLFTYTTIKLFEVKEAIMESIRIPFKNDTFGNPIFARVSWSNVSADSQKPIGEWEHFTCVAKFAERNIALIYHAGGLVVGSSEIVPKSQIEYLLSKDFVVVMPNYRLVPQVTGKEAFEDSEEAYDWTVKSLSGIMLSEHKVKIDTSRVVAIGHSSGGTMALNLAICRPVKAVTAFCPFIFVADSSTNAHKPTSTPSFGDMPQSPLTEADWTDVKPARHQLSEAPLWAPGMPLNARHKWMINIFKTGQWLRNVQPDGDYAAIDPMTRLGPSWPPIMIVHGSEDHVPGRSLELVRRAEETMKHAGVNDVQLEVVDGAGHLFDHNPSVGSTNLGPKWQGVVKGLEWVCSRA